MLDYAIILSSIAFLLYSYLNISKITKKKWIGKKLLLAVKIIVLVPFWAAFFYFIVPFVVPEVEQYYKSIGSTQDFYIDNTEEYNQKFLIIGRMHQTNDWVPVYSSFFDFNLSPIVAVPANNSIEITVSTGKNHFDIIGICKLSGTRYKTDDFKAFAFEVPKNPIKVYSHQFNRETFFEKVDITLKKEILLFLLSLTAVFGVLYHSFSTRGKLWFVLPIYTIYSATAILAIYVVYCLSFPLWYLLR